jgi:hypothetical protein
VASIVATDLSRLANQRRVHNARIMAALRIILRRQWQRLDPAALTPSWDGGIGRQMLVATSAAQLAAAQGAGPFVAAAMELQGLDPSDSEGTLIPEALAGIASDGRSLAGLLYQPIIQTKFQLGEGAVLDDAMRGGFGSLERIAETQIADAARVGVGVEANAKPKIQWYVRTLTPPSCARCVILAGKITSVEKAFERHPRCDCENLPVGDQRLANDMVRSPMDYFKSLSMAEQRRTFTKAGAAAINDGADIFQVVNARRGMSATDNRFTTEGTSRRGLARQGGMKGRRLTPEAIYALASDRTEIVRLLRQYGYLA